MLLKTHILTLFFTLLVTTCSVIADSRTEDLHKEMERQEQMYWQEQVNLKFSQLKNHFSNHEMEQAQKQNMGVELSKISPSQMTALHNLLSSALPPLGYLRAVSLLGLQNIHKEMGNTAGMGFLIVDHSETQKKLTIKSPTFSITLEHQNNSWEIAYLYMGQWPRQISEAPQPDLTTADIHYPYVRWNEAVGMSPLGQTAKLAIRAINELPTMLKKQACLGSSSEMNCSLRTMDINDTEGVTLSELSAQGRYLLKMLIMQLQGHMEFTESSDIADIKLSWAGDIPTHYHTSDNKDLLINLTSRNEHWQIVMSGSKPSQAMEQLPPDALIIRYGKGRVMPDMLTENFGLIQPNPSPSMPDPLPGSSTEEMPSHNSKPSDSDDMPADIKRAGGDGSEMDDIDTIDDDSDITWLKNPAFLNTMALSIGYAGDRISTRIPLTPVVIVKKDGRIHKNIRITITLGLDGSGPWLKNLPLVFQPETGDYRTTLHLPVSMSGGNLDMKFTIHEPGTRYEGLYDYKVKVGTGEAMQTPHF